MRASAAAACELIFPFLISGRKDQINSWRVALASKALTVLPAAIRPWTYALGTACCTVIPLGRCRCAVLITLVYPKIAVNCAFEGSSLAKIKGHGPCSPSTDPSTDPLVDPTSKRHAAIFNFR